MVLGACGSTADPVGLQLGQHLAARARVPMPLPSLCRPSPRRELTGFVVAKQQTADFARLAGAIREPYDDELLAQLGISASARPVVRP